MAREYAASIAGRGDRARPRRRRCRPASWPRSTPAACWASRCRARTAAPTCSASVLAEVIRVIAAVDPAIAQVPQAHFLFVDVLAVLGTAQQRRLFAEVLDGGRLGNGLAERGGKHAQDLKTRLRGSPARCGRPQVLLHRRDHRPLDRCHRARRRRPSVLAFVPRDAGRRADRRGLERDGPARHGQRQRGLRRRRR